jgi:hypothetical protein
MIDRTNLGEIVFWILFIGMAFECNIHWTYLILPAIISSITSLVNYENKLNNND